MFIHTRYLVFFVLLFLINFSLYSPAHTTLKQAPLLFDEITFSSDIPFSSHEFFYLTELKENTWISSEKLNEAIFGLEKKGRFASIDKKIIRDPAGTRLHFTLIGNWILKKCTLRGIVFGKQMYTSLYTQQPGDVFDITLHEESLKAIKRRLHNQGYLAAQVTDELISNKNDKTIQAFLHVARGKRFIIKEVSFSLLDKAHHAEKITQSLHKQLVRRFAETLINSYYKKKHIKKLARKIQSFLKQNGFLHARIIMKRTSNHTAHTASICFSINLGKQKKLAFAGNTIFSDRYIKEELIGEDEPDWLFSPDVIREQLLYEYYKRGYWQTTINYKSLDSQGYLFFITEGKPVLVDQIIVHDVETNQREATTSFWKDLLKKRTLDLQLLDTCIENLKAFYRSNGFWLFKIIDKKIIKNTDNDLYQVKIFIKKGPQYFFGKMKFPKEFSSLETTLFNNFQFNNDWLIPFNINWLQKQKVQLLNHFQQQGFWFVTIKPSITKRVLKKKSSDVLVDINWNIKKGSQARFGKVILKGNTKLPFKRILKEVKCKEGDLWSKEKLELTRKKLKRLNIFKNIQLEPYQLSNSTNKKPLLLTLVDDDQLELRLRAGYFLTSKNFFFKQKSTPKIGSSVIIKNPGNKADTLTFKAEATRFERKINVNYQQPSLFGQPVAGKIKGYVNKYVHPIEVGSNGSAYESQQNGFLLGLSDEYKENYYWGLTTGSEWITTSRVRGNLNFEERFIDRTLPYFFFEPSLVVDNRDKTINTTKGNFSFASLKVMVPYRRGSVYTRLMLEQSLFIPAHQNITLAGRIRFGHIFRRAFNLIMPIERFYLGGPYSVRGYEKDALPPLGVTKTTNNGKEEVHHTIQGGSSMINGNLELRFSVFKNISTVLFQDVGVLSQNGFDGFSKKWFPTSGVGLRYKTPIGALRFDIGWKWKKRIKQDTSYAWYLTLGEAF